MDDSGKRKVPSKWDGANFLAVVVKKVQIRYGNPCGIMIL